MILPVIVDDEAEEGGEGVTVVNLVDAHKLNETTFSKKDFMALVKAYLKRVVGFLKENGKEDRVKGFQAGATTLVKLVIEKFDEF